MVDGIGLSRPSVASVVGVASDVRWGQVLTTPHAYGVVEVHSSDGVARVQGIQLLTKLTRLFLTPPVSLSKLSVIADALICEDVVSMLLLVPVGATLYIVVRGAGSVFLKRENKLATLMDGPGELSGDIKAGDTVIAGSASFMAAFSANEIMSVFDHLAPEVVAEKLSLMLHKRGSGEGASALIFQIEERHEVLPPSPPVPRKTIFVSRALTIGRRITTPAIRSTLRRVFLRIKEKRALSPQRIIVYVVLALFMLSVVLGVRREYIVKRNSVISETMRQARFSYDEGVALLELNPVKGRERLTTARDLLAPVVAKKGSSKEAKEAKKLYDEVITYLTRAMRISKVVPELFFDISLIKQGATASDISLFETAIGAIDTIGLTAFRLGLTPKTGVMAGGGSALSGMNQVAMYGDALYIQTPAGIHRVSVSEQKTTQNVIPSSTEWGVISDMVVFGGNVYLLDTAKSRIWKYVTQDKGFSQLYEYLNPDTLPDLSKTTNMAIDGSVWLGTTIGQIYRFTAGKENSISLQGVDSPLGKYLVVYTDADTKRLYILDRDNNRVVVFDKDGLYIAQYVWEKEFLPSEMVVSESMEKILLLRDGKIYTLDLK